MADPSSGFSPTDDVTLQSVLSNSGKSLSAMKDKRMTLQHNIQHKFHDINQTITDYWVTQAKSLTDHVSLLGRNVDEDKWRIDFATREITRAEAAAAKQKQLWSEIEAMVKEAKDRDDKFWATWRTSLDQLAASEKPFQQSSLLSEAAKGSLRPPRHDERSLRAIAKGPVPRGPTAFTAKSKSESKPAAILSSSGRTKSARNVADNASLGAAHTRPSSNLSPTTSSPINNSSSTFDKMTRHGRAERPARKAAAKPLTVSAPSKASKPVKKRTLKSLAKSPSNPQPVTNPIPGQLYQAYYHSPKAKERGWYMGTVLPWKSSDWAYETMIDFSMQDMDLLSDWPDCCQPGLKTKTMLVDGKLVEAKELTCIEEWRPGFEDGGPRVVDRKFLFLFFEDRPNRLGCLDIDPTQPMKLIKFGPSAGEPVPIDWVEAKNLRLNNDDDNVVWGSFTAEKYRNKLDSVARLREQQAHSPAGLLTSQQQSVVNPNALSPVQMDVDEAYEESQSSPKRTVGKRPLGSDDEYDEGLGMDYDLNLKKSATTMSRPQTSLMGLPPHKLPRLDDYNVPAISADVPGLRSSNAYISPGTLPSRGEPSTNVPVSPEKYDYIRDAQTEPIGRGNHSLGTGAY